MPRNHFKKLPIRAETRRVLARRYGCSPGGQTEASCAHCGEGGRVVWFKQPRGAGWVVFPGLEIDHIVPEFRGGDGQPNNLTLACLPCNRGRRDKLLSEWRPNG